MSGAGIVFELFRGDTTASSGEPRQDVKELWFALARSPWSSLVLVPADEGISAAALARSLADVGGRLRDTPVTAIVADSMDYESARILADLQLRVQDQRIVGTYRPDPSGVPEGAATPPAAAPGSPANGDTVLATAARPKEAGQIVVAIQAVVVEPLGVAVAHAADAVILCIGLGKTRLDRARRTIELIGADRIVGAVLVD